VLSGLADARVDISLPEPVSKYEVGINGQPLTQFRDISTTLQLNTTNIKNGTHTLVIEATGESGLSAQTQQIWVAANTRLRTHYRPMTVFSQIARTMNTCHAAGPGLSRCNLRSFSVD